MTIMHQVLERKYASAPLTNIAIQQGEISGYASVFGIADQSGDIVQKGAFSLNEKGEAPPSRAVKMLWQHDPAQPIGIWHEIKEDGHGLFVRGRILDNVQMGKEALALIEAGAVDGLSIGYQTLQSQKQGKNRLLLKLRLWEISLVTFPMNLAARVSAQKAQVQKPSGRALQKLQGEIAQICQDIRKFHQEGENYGS